MYAPAQVIVLEPDHRRIAHARMLGQDRLHLRRHHVGAAGDDLVHAPVGQEQVTVRIDVAEVADAGKVAIHRLDRLGTEVAVIRRCAARAREDFADLPTGDGRRCSSRMRH